MARVRLGRQQREILEALSRGDRLFYMTGSRIRIGGGSCRSWAAGSLIGCDSVRCQKTIDKQVIHRMVDRSLLATSDGKQELPAEDPKRRHLETVELFMTDWAAKALEGG